MTILVEVPNKKYLPYYKYEIYRLAKIKILCLKISSAEAKLNRYLLQEYNIGLKPLCLWILQNMKFSSNLDSKIVVKIKNPKLDRLARLITYGNGKVQGSQILKRAISL